MDVDRSQDKVQELLRTTDLKLCRLRGTCGKKEVGLEGRM